MKKLFIIAFLMLIVSGTFAQLGGFGKTTVAKVIGLQDSLNVRITQDEADVRYPQISELVDPTPLIYSTIAIIPTTSVTDNYTLILTDAGKFISMTAATDKTITIPLFATVEYPINTVIYFENLGAADLIIAITATGTLTSESSWVKIPAKCTAFIRKSATNTWNLAGRLKA